jgi:hypothetical protein
VASNPRMPNVSFGFIIVRSPIRKSLARTLKACELSNTVSTKKSV